MAAIKPAPSINPHENFNKFRWFIDKLLATKKLKKAVSHRSHLLIESSILFDQNMLNVPKENNTSKDSLRPLNFILKSLKFVLK